MRRIASASTPQRDARRALLLVSIMLLASAAPILTLPGVSAHQSASDTIWPQEGSNDTGWVQLDAIGANGVTGAQASASWTLEFAPGAELSNVSFQVRVNGSDGLMIEEPMLVASDVGVNLLDWRGLGMLGSHDSFTGPNPYSGRLSPNSDSGATWTLPSDAEITELIIEALTPVDPVVALAPLELTISAAAIHPEDGRMYLAIEESLMTLDYSNDPIIIDIMEMNSPILDIVIDTANNVFHLLTEDDGFLAYSLEDTSEQTGLPPLGTTQPNFDTFVIASDGFVYAANENGIAQWNGLSWSSPMIKTSPGKANSILEVDNVLYVAFEDEGVVRWDLSSSTALSTWSTANALHSDDITEMMISGNQILFASQDNGLARYDWSSGFWLSTWNNGNWLASNTINGMARSGADLFVLSGDTLHIYDTAVGVFTGSQPISNFGLTGDGVDLLVWPSIGARSPSSELLLLGNGFGSFAELSASPTLTQIGTLLIGSGPTSSSMQDATELNDVVFVAAGEWMNRFDAQSSRWLQPVYLGTSVNQLMNDGSHVFIASESGLHMMHSNGTLLQTWDTANTNLSQSEVIRVDSDGTRAVAITGTGDLLTVDLSGAVAPTVQQYDTPAVDVVLFSNTVHLATDTSGVLRYDLSNNTWLTPWISTGVNGADNVPVAVTGDILYFGIPGYGVARKDLSTGELMTPLVVSSQTSSPSTGVLPSDTIYALEADGSNLYIGTSGGAIEWDGASSSSFQTGRQWNTRPQQYFDFTVTGGDVYAGTNIGVCKWPTNQISSTDPDCLNVYDGMPNWATYSVEADSYGYIFGGTTSGVGIITTSPYDVIGEWEAGEQTDNAPVEVIDDIAYIGLNGIGIARYDMPNNAWLSVWTEDNVLDNGNQDVTALIADINPGNIWIGGDDGLQLLNTTTGAEVFDIEKNSNLYGDGNGENGDPFDLRIHNDVMYYHTGSSDVFRLDIANYSVLSELAVDAQVNENNGIINGLNIIGDILMASVSSNQWWQSDGSGGIAQWNISNGSWGQSILPIGQVDRVTAYQSSTGNMWVAWGESNLELMAANGTSMGMWDESDFNFPIREIVEYNGEVLFATEDGVARYNETSNQWLSLWEEGNGLPNNAGSRIYELWTDGTNLVVGGGDVSGFGQFQGGSVSHWDGTTWNQYSLGQSGTPNGYPISMAECAGLLHIGIYANNGGVARFDMANDTFVGSFTASVLDDGEVAGVACDATNTLYVGFYQDQADINKYSYATNSWITSITTATNNIPSDRIWWDAMDYANGQLVLGHGLGTSGDNIIGGGYTIIATSGNSNAQASINGAGSSVTSFQWVNNQWLVGQAGGSSGFSKVQMISSLGQSTVASLPGLVSGQVTTMTGNATHIWMTTAGTNQAFGQSSGAGLLQGERQTDGTMLWQEGWTMAANSQAQDAELIGTDLYITTTPTGMYKLDTLTGILTRINGGLHSYQDGMVLDGTTLVIGLMGGGGSAPGVQLYDLQTGFGNGKLIGGLPSNAINNFAATSDVLYIATNGGVGRWNYLQSDWLNPLTTSDGLPTNIVEDVLVEGSTLWMATPAGLAKMNLTTNTTMTYTSASGLMGTSTKSLTSYSPSTLSETLLFVGHDGAGNERPAVTTIGLTTSDFIGHEFDQLPSNNVDALASDYWGIHVATDIGPMAHWNSTSGIFESGIPSFQVFGWPVQKMVSDGEHVMIFGGNGVSIIEARTPSHQNIKMISKPMLTGGTISPDYLWLTTDDDGLYGFENTPQYSEIERVSVRYANPLNIGFNLVTQDVTDMTRPGMNITLADLDSMVALDSTQGVAGTNGVLFQTVPLAFTSPVNNAATWAQSKSLKYNATIELNNNPDFETSLQLALDNGVIVNGTQFLQLSLRSPSNGSMHVRLIYDYIRTETPISLTELIDRPDDGGKALLADWSLVHDENFARYLVYVNEGPFQTSNGLPVSADDLTSRTVDKAISLHSRLSSEITTANGQPLEDGKEYYAVVVVEYDDGHLGKPSAIAGPASPSNEIPLSPLWANAGPHEGGADGDLEIEWARCTSLDLVSTRMYTSTTPITDVLGLPAEDEILKQEGNTTVLSLEAGQPYWLGLTCVDESGQEDLMNPLIIGPAVPTGGLNDNTPPPKMENVAAEDTPDDDGGRITVSWDENPAEDCTFYAVFIRTWDDLGIQSPSSVEGDEFSQAKIVDDCSETSTTVTSIDGIGLEDGRTYVVGVVAYDDWLNANLQVVDLVQVTPVRNTAGSGSIPDRVGTINAFDHPDDDGTAVDVVWSISDADDFSHYIVWAADQPISDLSVAWAAFGDDTTQCACLKINKQWIDEDYNPIELSISTALYGGDSILDASPQIIKPGIELFVVVTVHDLAGNVHLTDLPQASVIPVDNLQDVTAPLPLTALELSDRPNDGGGALLLDFELSNESDVANYEVYAATWSFDAVGMGSSGPATPIAVLSRMPELPLTIDIVAGDTPVIAGQEIWAAVVVRDTAGNAQEINLVSVSAQSIDDGVDNLGGYLDPIEDIALTWNDETNILVEWTHSADSSVRGYRLYISDIDFQSTEGGDFIVEVKASNSFLITPSNYQPLKNTSAWYVAVTPFDDVFEREEVDPIMLDSYGKDGGNDGGQDSNNGNDFSSLLTTPNLLAAGLLVVALLLLVAIVRSRSGQKSRNRTLELQEATWGIQNDDWDSFGTPMPPPPMPTKPVPNISQGQANDIYAAAQRIENQDLYGRPVYQAPQPVMQPVQNNALLNEMADTGAPKVPQASIDTSFLDDLL